MVQFEVTSDKIQEWFPESYQSYIDELRSSKSKSNNIEESKIKWMVSWGFFIKKAITQEDFDNRELEFHSKMKMVYDERILVEIPKIKCSIHMKAGNYIRTDRSIDSTTPEFITNMAKEIIKFMMFREQEYFQYGDVMESIKDFTSKIEVIGDYDDNTEEITDMNVDDILDKINSHGMSSLSSKELEFLEKMSRSGK